MLWECVNGIEYSSTTYLLHRDPKVSPTNRITQRHWIGTPASGAVDNVVCASISLYSWSCGIIRTFKDRPSAGKWIRPTLGWQLLVVKTKVALPWMCSIDQLQTMKCINKSTKKPSALLGAIYKHKDVDVKGRKFGYIIGYLQLYINHFASRWHCTSQRHISQREATMIAELKRLITLDGCPTRSPTLISRRVPQYIEWPTRMKSLTCFQRMRVKRMEIMAYIPIHLFLP